MVRYLVEDAMRINTGRVYPPKLNVTRNPALAAEWKAKQRPYCWFCGAHIGQLQFGLSVHHMAGAAGRSDELCNYALACIQCHEGCHDGTITLEHQLQRKLERDPENYAPIRVHLLKGRACPGSSTT